MSMEGMFKKVRDFASDENVKRHFPEAGDLAAKGLKGVGESALALGLIVSPPATAAESRVQAPVEQLQRSVGQLALDSLAEDVARGGGQAEAGISGTELACLEKNIYNEARGEIDEGQLAVAFVTLARAQSKGFPSTICGVVYQNKQFSWTFDRSILSPRPIEGERALHIRMLLRDLVAGQHLADATTLLGMMLGLPAQTLYYKHEDWTRDNPDPRKRLTKATADMFDALHIVKQIDHHVFYSDPLSVQK
jgi:hypothetical protein